MSNLKITYMDKKLNENFASVKGKSGIKIKKANKGKFTDYCGGKVTDGCILKGLNSRDPAVRKRANFARNARKWKHCGGGYLHTFKIIPNHVMDSNPNLDNMKRKYEEGGFFNSDTILNIYNTVSKTALEISTFNKQLKLLDKYATALRSYNRYKALLKGTSEYNNTLGKQQKELEKTFGTQSSNIDRNFDIWRIRSSLYDRDDTESEINQMGQKIKDNFDNRIWKSLGEGMTKISQLVGDYFTKKKKEFYSKSPNPSNPSTYYVKEEPVKDTFIKPNDPSIFQHGFGQIKQQEPLTLDPSLIIPTFNDNLY